MNDPIESNEGAVAGSSPVTLFGSDDPRLEILRKAPTDTLTHLVGEIVAPSIGCSFAFFAIGMSAEFRTTRPPVFLELIFAVLRERLPNTLGQASQPEGGKSKL